MTKHKIVIIKDERSTIGIKVRELLKNNLNCETLHTIKTNIENDLQKMKTGNDKRAHLQYRVVIDREFTNNETLQIWHKREVKDDVLVLTAYKI